MRLRIPIMKVVAMILFALAFVFAVGGATPQGRGRKVGQVIHIPGVGAGARQACVQSCNSFHRNESQVCKGRTGRDRASCQQSINEQHRLCILSCPK
jgi:hypothetical protein